MKHKQLRPTIGFLTPSIHAPIVQALWPGVLAAARQYDVNLVYFAGGTLQAQRDFQGQANIIYDLITQESVDGLISWSSTVYYDLRQEEIHRFHARYHPLPIVCIGKAVAGCPTVMMDNVSGMRALLTHLIDTHGYSHLAFMRGPETHQYAQERYHTYLQVLQDYHLPVIPELVTPPLNWFGTDGGAEAIRLLLDERRLQPKRDIEVLIGAIDSFALSAICALNARGIRVPDDLAVVGFNDVAEGRLSTPSLTTVTPQFFEQGQQAVRLLWSRLEGTPVADLTKVPSTLVVRRSCGCFAPIVVRAAPSESAAPPVAAVALSTRREPILAAMLQAAGHPDRTAPWAEQVFDAFVHDLHKGVPAKFLAAIEAMLRHELASDSQIERWHDVLSALRCQSLGYLEDRTLLSSAEDLWQQARILIGEALTRHQMAQQWQIRQQIQAMGEIEALLSTTFELEQILTILAEGLPRLGIVNGILALYEDPQPYTYPQPIPAWSRVRLACAGQQRLEGQLGEQRLPTVQIMTSEFFPRAGCFVRIIEPLYVREEQLGFLVLGIAPHEAPVYDGVYETLRREISSTLQGALLMQRVQERSAELARQKYILDTFLENVPDSIYFKDRDSRITHANKAHARRIGLTDPAEELGKTDFDFFPEPLARLKYAQEQEIIRTGQPIIGMEEFNEEGRWDLATKMPLRDEHGTIIGTFGISRDITPLKQVELSLRRLEKAVETTDVGITITDNDGRIIYLNPAEAQMHGYTVAELLGQQANIFAPPEYRESSRHSDTAANVISYWRRERTNMRKDGTIFPVRLISNPITDAGGQLLGKVTVCEDITDRKQAEHALLEAHAELRQKNVQLAELNASKDAFFSIISHDLRSPFTAILGFARLLHEQFDRFPPEQVKKNIAKIHTAAERLYALLENLLTWSRIQRGAMDYSPGILALGQLVNDVFALYRSHAEQKQISFHMTISPQTTVYADEQMLETVLRNLISNALKFTPSGGRVEVSALQRETLVEIAISDTGIGIPVEDRSKLFHLEAHYTQKGTAGEQGTGLGLSLCKDLLQKNGGDIWVESGQNQGTTFRFTVPTPPG